MVSGPAQWSPVFSYHFGPASGLTNHRDFHFAVSHQPPRTMWGDLHWPWIFSLTVTCVSCFCLPQPASRTKTRTWTRWTAAPPTSEKVRLLLCALSVADEAHRLGQAIPTWTCLHQVRIEMDRFRSHTKPKRPVEVRVHQDKQSLLLFHFVSEKNTRSGSRLLTFWKDKTFDQKDTKSWCLFPDEGPFSS